MKATLLAMAMILLPALCIRGQENDLIEKGKYGHIERVESGKRNRQRGNRNTTQGEIRHPGIPINASNGQNPAEPQLDIIREVLKNDFLVNDDTTGGAEQRSPCVAMNSMGYFVIVWQDYRNGDWDIYFQRYDNSGVALGLNTKVNDDGGSAWQWYPSVAMDDSGRFVVVWQDHRNGNWDIYFQRFDNNGTPLGANVRANDDMGMSKQAKPSVAMDDNGRYVIAWEDGRNGGSGSDIYHQLYDNRGEALGANTITNDDFGNEDQCSPSVAMGDSGQYVVAWKDHRYDNWDIYYQRYKNGAAIGVNAMANDDDGTAEQRDPDIAMDGSGYFVIVWEDFREGNRDIYYQRYDNKGDALETNTRANDDFGSGDQATPSVAMGGNGHFVITWKDWRGDTENIYYQHYDSNGNLLGTNMKTADDSGTAGQWNPAVAMDGMGYFVIVWEDSRNRNTDIYYQRYYSYGAAMGVNRRANDDEGSAVQSFPCIGMGGSGHFLIGWQDERNGDTDIYFQRFDNTSAILGFNTKANDDAGTLWQEHPSVATDDMGNFVIVWQDLRNGMWDIYSQRYDSNAIAQGPNIKVNDDVGTALQLDPCVAMDGSGRYGIAWEDRRNGGSDIYYQRYDNSGVALGSNIKVNDDVGTAEQRKPCIAMDGRGNIVIVWQDERNGDGDIYYQRYDSTGAALGQNTRVNDDSGSAWQWDPSVAMAANGDFVVVWEDYRNRGGNADIYYQRYNNKGAAVGANARVNDDVGTADQRYPSVAMNDSGYFVIVWEDYRYGTSEVIGQRYFPDGSLNGTNYRIVAADLYSCGRYPVVAANNNAILFAWMDNRRSKSWDIYAKMVDWSWDGPTSVSKDERNIPVALGLQSYPNPFNPRTIISYTLPEAGNVTLAIYDLLGNRVAELVSGYQSAGRYSAVFDGEELAAGIYFCMLSSGQYRSVIKLTLVK